MNKTIKRQGFLLLLLLTAGCFILSSCGLSLFGLSGGGAKSDIEDAVKSYLDEIQDGSFSDSGYKSDYAEDTPFADLTFEDPDVKDIMDKGLEKMDYEIGDISGSVKDEEGTWMAPPGHLQKRKRQSGLSGMQSKLVYNAGRRT